MQMRQHIELYENDANTPPSVIGTIDKFCNVASILKAAGSTAQTLCRSHYGMAPDFKVSTVTECPEPITLAYPPSHLFHIGFELLKNSMRAVVEFHSKKTDDLPPVDVALSQGEEDITIKISDAGGGIPKSQINNIWTYLFTTAESPNLDEDFSADVYHAPIAGFGYGLPLARLYARYFGTDALVYLKRKMAEAREVLPRLDSASVGNYNPTNSEDWMVSQIYPRRTLPMYG
jgi:pyruvate dehydrogenase kinase 2/3/4